MNWKEAFREHLAFNSGVQLLVKNRVRHGHRKQQDPLPEITFFAVWTEQEHTLTHADGLPSVHIQIDCWGRTSREADDLREAVRLAVDGFRGNMRGIFVQSCLLTDGGQDEYETPQDGSDRGTERVTLDVNLSFEETVPTF